MISEICNLLLAPGTPFALVDGVVAMAQLTDRPPAMPAAYVLALGSASSENQYATGFLQHTAEDVGVVIIFENLSTPLGDPGTDELEALLKWVRGQLAGAVIDDDFDALEHISGDLVKARGGVVWWQERFGTSHDLEGA